MNNVKLQYQDMVGIIYCARCLANGKCYIGYTTKSLELRKRVHLSDSLTKQHKFAKALRKYGVGVFEWSVLYYDVPASHLECMERWAISNFDSFENGYNSTFGGDGMLGFKHSDDTKRVLAERSTGKTHSESSKAKMSEVQLALGKQYGTETRAKIGEKSKGRVSSRFSGKRHTDAARLLIGAKSKERGRTPESIEKARLSLTGIKGAKESTSKYVGVSWQKGIGRWRAKLGGKYLGVFEYEIDAAKRYNEEAIKMYGEKAKLNTIGKDDI
jgi:group I intron endonuclease